MVTKRFCLVILFLILAGYQFLSAQGYTSFIKVKKDAPNILWICTDQQRWNTIGALGNKWVYTPNLDKLVKGGVSFLNAFCQAPACTPSRASFMTGMYASTVLGDKLGEERWPESAPLISEILYKSGYDCGLSGKLHLSTAMAHLPEKRPVEDGYRQFYFSHSPGQGGSSNQYLQWLKSLNLDYDSIYKADGYIPAPYHQTTWCTNQAIDFMNEKREQPWFFSLNIYDPHPPFDPPKKYTDRYDIRKIPDPWVNDPDIANKSDLNDIIFQSQPKKYTEKQMKERMIKYWAQIDLIDENIGRILKDLEKTGQLENTIIIFSTDHGNMLGDHGLRAKGVRFYEGLVHIPLLFYYPKQFKQNLQSSALVELTDIFPTILDATGIEIPDNVEGKTLLPILGGAASPSFHRKFVRSECYDCFAPGGKFKSAYATMLRTDRYKIVNYHAPSSKGELYDLKEDPEEFHNLWDDPGYQKIKMELMQKSFDETVKSLNTGPERVARY